MGFHEAITANWPYKVAAVSLSVMLWLNVTADQERVDQPISTRIEFEVSDSLWSIRDAPTEVTTIFSGRRGDIIALFDRPVIRQVIDAVDDSILEVTLGVDDVEFDRTLSVIATAISPPRLVLHMEPRAGHTIPVVAVSDATSADGYVIERTVVEPESVTVFGPASIVGRLSEVSTEEMEVGPLDQRLTRPADLVFSDDLANLEIKPSRVSVSFEVDSVMTRQFQVAVTAVGPAASSVSLDPVVVRVDVTGGGVTLHALTPTDLIATVEVDSIPNSPLELPVRVLVPPDVDVRATPDPALVTARPRGTQSPADDRW